MQVFEREKTDWEMQGLKRVFNWEPLRTDGSSSFRSCTVGRVWRLLIFLTSLTVSQEALVGLRAPSFD